MAVETNRTTEMPVELLQLSPFQLGIVWSDGHRSEYNVRNIRLECRCAHCIDEWTREKILKPESVPMDIRPEEIESVGRYALKIDWNDGHDTGIFTFDQLRKLCECASCKA